MLEIERHLVWIAVGEDQVVGPVELGQNMSGLTADDADTVAVPVPCDLELGEAHVLGVAFDRLDEPARTVGEADRRIAEATPDLENPFRSMAAARTARNGTLEVGYTLHPVAVRFPMLVRGAGNGLERVASTVSRLDPFGATLSVDVGSFISRVQVKPRYKEICPTNSAASSWFARYSVLAHF